MGKKARKLKRGLPSQNLSAGESPGAHLKEKIGHIILGILLFAALGVAITVRLIHLDISVRSPDERTYTYQADKIVQNGIKAIPQLISEYAHDKSLWDYPPPVRIGFDYLLANVMKMRGHDDAMAGTYISTFSSIGTLLILMAMGLRFFNPWVTFFALLGMGLSPMELAIARRCWVDSLLEFVGIVFIYLCAELIKNPKQRLLYLPLLLVGIYCLLVKEFGIVIFGLGMLWLFYEVVVKQKSPINTLLTVLTGLVTLIVSLIVLNKVTGGLLNVLGNLKDMRAALPTNSYAVDYTTGPWYLMFEGLGILTPFFSIFALSGCAAVIASKKFKGFSSPINIQNIGIVRAMALFFVVFVTITIATPYSQNVRYISAVYVPFYLLAGMGLWLILYFFKERSSSFAFSLAAIIVTLVVVLFAYHDYQVFKYIFLERGILDLSIRLLKEVSSAL